MNSLEVIQEPVELPILPSSIPLGQENLQMNTMEIREDLQWLPCPRNDVGATSILKLKHLVIIWEEKFTKVSEKRAQRLQNMAPNHTFYFICEKRRT